MHTPDEMYMPDEMYKPAASRQRWGSPQHIEKP